MGLRTEQMNIEDLLKYFVSRNEFSRETIMDLISNLTLDEIGSLNFLTQKDLSKIYEEIRKQVENLISGTENSEDIIINDNELSANSYYYKDFLFSYPFKKVLKLRGISYSEYSRYEDLFVLVQQSNPLTGTKIKSDSDLNSIDDIKAEYIYENPDVLIRLVLKEILDKRGVIYSDSNTTEELFQYIEYTNPMYITNNKTDNTIYIEGNLNYTDNFLVTYGYKVLLSERGISYSEDATLGELQTLCSNSTPSTATEVNTKPINSRDSYTNEFLSEYGYLILLEKRGITDFDNDNTLSELQQAVKESDNETNDNFMTLQEITEALENDPEFYKRLDNLENKVDNNFAILSNTDTTRYNANLNEINKLKADLSAFSDSSAKDTDKKIATAKTELTKDFDNKLQNISVNHTNDINTLKTNLTTEYKNADTNILNQSKSYTDSKVKTLTNTVTNNASIMNNFINVTYNSEMIKIEDRLDNVEYLINQMLTTTESGRFIVKRSNGKFTGPNGTVVKHNLGQKPTAVFLHYEENAKGKLGEIWMTYDENDIIVYNSGTATTKFYYVAFVATDDTGSKYMESGKAKYAGAGKTVKVNHSLGKVPTLIEVTPAANPNGLLGEYRLVTATSTYFEIENTGTFTGEFVYSLMVADTNDTIKTGTSAFLGSSNTLSIPHGIGKVPTLVSIYPTSKTGNLLGETYVRYDENYIYIENTGSGKPTLTWSAYYTELNQSNDVYLRYADSGASNVDGYFDREDEMPSGETILNYSGKFRATNFNANGTSIAFACPTSKKFVEGDVICFDTLNNEYYCLGVRFNSVPLKKKKHDEDVFVGICSYNYGFLMGELKDNYSPVVIKGMMNFTITTYNKDAIKKIASLNNGIKLCFENASGETDKTFDVLNYDTTNETYVLML